MEILGRRSRCGWRWQNGGIPCPARYLEMGTFQKQREMRLLCSAFRGNKPRGAWEGTRLYANVWRGGDSRRTSVFEETLI